LSLSPVLESFWISSGLNFGLLTNRHAAAVGT